MVLEYRMDRTVATADEPPVVLGTMPAAFVERMGAKLRCATSGLMGLRTCMDPLVACRHGEKMRTKPAACLPAKYEGSCDVIRDVVRSVREDKPVVSWVECPGQQL